MEELYIRVGTTIYKVVQQPLVDGTTITRRIQWSFGTIRQDYGKNNIPPITKYNGFCTVPSHFLPSQSIMAFVQYRVILTIKKRLQVSITFTSR